MNIKDFDFNLPDELIAQHPTKNRQDSKLLVCPGSGEDFEQVIFADVLNYIKPNDLLIFNNSKVINAQITLEKGKKKINVNLNKQVSDNCWNAFAKPARALQIGDDFGFASHHIIIKDKLDNGMIIVEFNLDNMKIVDFLDQYGAVPLPPYIKRQKQLSDDKERYQSVLAKHAGSVAAPTASLHFTQKIIQDIRTLGAEIVEVTLHVGAGTFLPVKVNDIEKHVMHSEFASVSKESAQIINKAKDEGRRIVVVGTTAMRTIESFTKLDENNKPFIDHGTKDTSIFIKPGHKFHFPDVLITNFHLPRSTLFMLISAFANLKSMQNAYKYAIKNKLRFLSYGDAMIIYKDDKNK